MGDMKSISVTKESSKGVGVPAGAEVLKADTNVRVKKIENGYIVSKSTDTKYMLNGETNWDYSTKEFYSKTDPFEIKIKNKSLADSFDV
jgi:hypothetical protein